MAVGDCQNYVWKEKWKNEKMNISDPSNMFLVLQKMWKGDFSSPKVLLKIEKRCSVRWNITRLYVNIAQDCE